MPVLMLAIVLILSGAGAHATESHKSLEQWADQQADVSLEKLLENISPKGTLPGTVIASPSTDEPNYFFHWVRDGALVLSALYDYSQVHALAILPDFVALTRLQQTYSGFTHLGEPKYEVDGHPYTGPWGRPQNDGPALRALVLLRYAKQLLQEGQVKYVKTHLYSKTLATQFPIKMDLEYTARYAHQASFDLWEEIKGQNFYTRVAVYSALKEGAELARLLDDPEGAEKYTRVAAEMAEKLREHFFGHAYIHENLHREDGIWYKDSHLDVASVLAFLHSPHAEDILPLDDPKVQMTVVRLAERFAEIYPVNRSKMDMAPGIGRYPEDIYYEGNPWFLATLALAEYYYRVASKAGSGVKAEAAFQMGDQFLQRVRHHTGLNGQMDEQFSRHNGYMLSARDLTWSYAAFLTAYKARQHYLQNR